MADEDRLDEAPLADVEAAVQDALARGHDDHLRVLGYGEITLVIGWPTDAPQWACKRLPVFDSFAAAHAYGGHLDEYLDVLRERGVEPVPSRLRLVEGSTRAVAYVVQPVLDAAGLGPEVLRRGEDHEARRLLRHVIDLVPGVVDDRIGIDGQISNWALVDGEVRYLDVSTPMLFDEAGRFVLDLDPFLAAYPWLLRAPIGRFVAPDVIGAYRDARHVLVDLVANLVKERLERWLPTAIDMVDEVVVPAVTEDEVRAFYRSDARLWEAMLRLRRADRWWQRNVRRRTYPFLLPGPIER